MLEENLTRPQKMPSAVSIDCTYHISNTSEKMASPVPTDSICEMPEENVTRPQMMSSNVSTDCIYEVPNTPEKICEVSQGNVTPQKKTSSVPSNSIYEIQEGSSSDSNFLDSEIDSDSLTSVVYKTKRSRKASKTVNEPLNKDTHVLTLKNRGFSTPKKSAGIVRRTWSTPEKLVVRKYFQKCIDQNTLPSLNECETVVKEEKVLKSRTAQQLKLFISNQIKKKSVCTGSLFLWSSKC